MGHDMKDGIIATVTGTVARVFNANGTWAFDLEWTRPNQQWPTKVTVWDLAAPEKGARLSVRGQLSWQLKEYEKEGQRKQYVNVSLRASEVLEASDFGPAAAATAAAGWDAEEPF